MPESDVLLTIAEVATAFAGFASLVGILGRGGSAADPRILSLRMRAMLLTSLIVVGFALLPVLLALYGADARPDWVLSSAALAAVNLAYDFWLRGAIRAAGRAGLTPTRFQRLVIIPTLLLTSVAVTLFLVVNLVLARPANYVTALLLLLFQSGFAFALIVFSFLPAIGGELPVTAGVDEEG
ncbi:MAG TPA: hypothetical protein VFQ22_13815 [Longimicrobiales bacterium]|nr:hypothetical protein [Longimicrobiales bacterium]